MTAITLKQFFNDCVQHTLNHIYCSNVVAFEYAAQGKWEINTLIWLCCVKNSLMEDERKDKVQRERTPQNSKRHIPLVGIFLCCKMMDVHCSVWELCSVSN